MAALTETPEASVYLSARAGVKVARATQIRLTVQPLSDTHAPAEALSVYQCDKITGNNRGNESR